MKKIDEIEKNGNGVTSHFLKRTLSPKNIGHINTMISNLPDSIVHEIEYGGLGGFWAKFLSRFGIFAKYFTSSIWLYNVNVDETLLKYFRPHMHIDFPALRSYRIREHTRLASIMVKAIRDLTRYLKRCNKFTWKRHHKNKRRLMNAIGRNKFKFILFFTPIADAIGHLNFTDEWVMREIYWELDDMVRRLNNEHRVVWVLSDHEMDHFLDKSGRPTEYGDHSYVKRGFFSTNQSMGDIKRLRQGIKNHPNIASLDESIKRLDQKNRG